MMLFALMFYCLILYEKEITNLHIINDKAFSFLLYIIPGIAPTKGGNLRNFIMHIYVIWSNQETDWLVSCWLYACAMFDEMCFPRLCLSIRSHFKHYVNTLMEAQTSSYKQSLS